MTSCMNPHDCFTRANELFSRGHYLDAQTLYDRACRMEPSNAEYAQAKQKLQTLTFAFFKKGSGDNGQATGGSAECCGNSCECCGEACAEGGTECCCESCCESCDGCDGCCDGCDCDCG